jgi:hypothetical protein
MISRNAIRALIGQAADAERLERAIAAVRAAPDSSYEIEYRIVLADGECRWLAAKGRVLVDGNGRPTRMIGICRDTTERKRKEEGLEDGDRTRPPRCAPHRQRKDEFLALLAHELRNPSRRSVTPLMCRRELVVISKPGRTCARPWNGSWRTWSGSLPTCSTSRG